MDENATAIARSARGPCSPRSAGALGASTAASLCAVWFSASPSARTPPECSTTRATISASEASLSLALATSQRAATTITLELVGRVASRLRPTRARSTTSAPDHSHHTHLAACIPIMPSPPVTCVLRGAAAGSTARISTLLHAAPRTSSRADPTTPSHHRRAVPARTSRATPDTSPRNIASHVCDASRLGLRAPIRQLAHTHLSPAAGASAPTRALGSRPTSDEPVPAPAPPARSTRRAPDATPDRHATDASKRTPAGSSTTSLTCTVMDPAASVATSPQHVPHTACAVASQPRAPATAHVPLTSTGHAEAAGVSSPDHIAPQRVAGHTTHCTRATTPPPPPRPAPPDTTLLAAACDAARHAPPERALTHNLIAASRAKPGVPAPRTDAAPASRPARELALTACTPSTTQDDSPYVAVRATSRTATPAEALDAATCKASRTGCRDESAAPTDTHPVSASTSSSELAPAAPSRQPIRTRQPGRVCSPGGPPKPCSRSGPTSAHTAYESHSDRAPRLSLRATSKTTLRSTRASMARSEPVPTAPRET